MASSGEEVVSRVAGRYLHWYGNRRTANVSPAGPGGARQRAAGRRFLHEPGIGLGPLRRAGLRRFRPDYVRRMAEKRQGECPNCPHDIIDPRDLKFCRNVCGYWFRDEDDPFRWRGRLGLARAGLAEVVCFSLLFGAVSLLIVAAAVGLCPSLCAGPADCRAVLGSRSSSSSAIPSGAIPTDPDALVSPADGTVTHVGEVDEPDFPGGRAFRISIFLSVFNVHVNRMPRTGRVVQLRYFPGELPRRPPCRVRRAQRAALDRFGGRATGSHAHQADRGGHCPADRLLAEAGRGRCGRASGWA